MSQSAGPGIVVSCACGKKLKAPESAAGKKVKCPGCGTLLTVPLPAAQPRTAAPAPLSVIKVNPTPKPATPKPATAKPVAVKPPPPPPEPNAEDDLYSLAADLAAPADLPEPSPVALINGNESETDLASARPARSAPVNTRPSRAPIAKRVKESTVDLMGPQASFTRGLLFCVGGALIGGAIWLGIAFSIHIIIGYTAILVGIMCGVGMQIGQQGYSNRGGTAAMLITGATILTCKVILVISLIGPQLAAVSQEQNFQEMHDKEPIPTGDISPGVRMFEERESRRHGGGRGVALNPFNPNETVEDAFRKLPGNEQSELIAAGRDLPLKDKLESLIIDREIKALNTNHVSGDEYEGFRKSAVNKVEAMKRSERIAMIRQMGGVVTEKEVSEAAENDAREVRLAAEAAKNPPVTAAPKALPGQIASSSLAMGQFFLAVFTWQMLIFMGVGCAAAYRAASGATGN